MIGRPAAAIGEETRGLEAQLADFFGLHYDRLIRLAALVCHAGVPVEDAVQSAMEQAWRRKHTLRDPERIRPWLDQIVVREAIRLNRNPWWGRIRGDRGGGVNASWIALVTAFRTLPADQRAVVALHLYAGYSVEETADITSAGIETTRSRLRLARQRLRTQLAEDPE
jgi:RNA polymerase sigma-70 factor (ECF subfamily)